MSRYRVSYVLRTAVVYDMLHNTMREYETMAEARHVALWLAEREAGYPRRPALDVYPPDGSQCSGCDGATWGCNPSAAH